MTFFNRPRWARVRSGGVRRFVLINGVLRFGGSSAAFLVALIWSISKFHLLGVEPIDSQFWPKALLLGLGVIVIGGPLWAVGTWYLSEWFFRRSYSEGDHAA